MSNANTFSFTYDAEITKVVITPDKTLINIVSFYVNSQIVECIDDSRNIADIIQDAKQAFPNASISLITKEDGEVTFVCISFNQNFNFGKGAYAFRFEYEDGNQFEIERSYLNKEYVN